MTIFEVAIYPSPLLHLGLEKPFKCRRPKQKTSQMGLGLGTVQMINLRSLTFYVVLYKHSPFTVATNKSNSAVNMYGHQMVRVVSSPPHPPATSNQ